MHLSVYQVFTRIVNAGLMAEACVQVTFCVMSVHTSGADTANRNGKSILVVLACCKYSVTLFLVG